MTQRLATVALLFPKEGSRKVNFKYLSCDVTFLVNIMVHTWSASIDVCFQSSCCFCFPTYITHNRHHGYQPVIFDQRTKECKSYDFKIEKWQVFLVLFFFQCRYFFRDLHDLVRIATMIVQLTPNATYQAILDSSLLMVCVQRHLEVLFKYDLVTC